LSPGAEVGVEVLIPHLDRRLSLLRTLDSLRAQTVAVAVCVADNGSTDGSLEMLATDYPEVRVIELGRNLGFGAAVNRAVEGSEALSVVLINNDAVAEPDFVERLIEARNESGSPAVAGCMLALDGTIESLGVEVDRRLSPFDCCHGAAPGSREAAAAQPLGPSGGAALYDRQAFLALGGFDERIFAYLEDVDLAIRARLAGFNCASAPTAVVHHEHSATLGAGSARKNELMGYSQGFLDWRYGVNLSRGERIGSTFVKAVVYSGKALIDRNVGVSRGWAAARRDLKRGVKPAGEEGWSRLPLAQLSIGAALKRRLGRRR
jgi:GT2 family glycosyltransferase